MFLQGELIFRGRKETEEESKCVTCTILVILLDMADGLEPSHIMIWFLENSGLQPSAFALFL